LRGSGGHHGPREKKAIKEIQRQTRRQQETANALSRGYDWSPEENSFLLNHRHDLTRPQMAAALGRTYYSVKFQLAKLNKESRSMGESKLKRIMEVNKIGLNALARELGVPRTNLSNIINHGVFTQKDLDAGIKNRIREALMKRGIPAAGIFKESRNDRLSKIAAQEQDEKNWRAEMIDQSALDFFNLKDDPFDLAAVRSVQDIYWTTAHKDMKAAIERAVTRKDFMAVSGEVGAGKSLVRKSVIESLDGKHRVITPVNLEKETLTPFHLQEAIIEDLKGGQPDYSKPTRASKEARERQVLELLKLYHSEGITVVLVIEEAHALPLKVLRTLKRLYEIQAGFEPMLGIILVGQPELEEFWQDLRVREFNRRCRLHKLPNLRAAEISAYIRHKFTRAGENADKVFAAGALEAISDRLKAGSPALQVNNLVARAINRAAEVKLRRVTAQFVYDLD